MGNFTFTQFMKEKKQATGFERWMWEQWNHCIQLALISRFTNWKIIYYSIKFIAAEYGVLPSSFVINTNGAKEQKEKNGFLSCSENDCQDTTDKRILIRFYGCCSCLGSRESSAWAEGSTFCQLRTKIATKLEP